MVYRTGFFFYTATKSWKGYIFITVYLCGCLSVWLSVYLSVYQLAKFKPNGCTDLDAIFAKWLLTILALTLLN